MRVAGHPIAEPFGSRQDDVSELADPAEAGRKRREEEFVRDDPRLARAVARTQFRSWIHQAFERRWTSPPNNERAQFARNRSGRFADGRSDLRTRVALQECDLVVDETTHSPADSPRFSVLPPSSGPSCATRAISSSTMVSGEHSRRALGQCRRIRGAVSLPLNRRHLELYGSRGAVPSEPGPGQSSGMRSKSL